MTFLVSDVYCILKHFTTYFSFCKILIVSFPLRVVPLNSESVLQMHIKRCSASH